MKILFSSNKNPYFITITEYIENALNKTGCQTSFFDDIDFIIPGQIRERIPYLNKLDLKRINKELISRINQAKSEILLVAGGHRILPETINIIKKTGVKTVLWTIDVPGDFDPIIEVAPYYDYVFTGGSEAYDILKDGGSIKNLKWLPFACDPDFHKPQILAKDEKRAYSSDIAFVGTLNPHLYPFRIRILEAISDLDLGVWGPGSEMVHPRSPLKQKIRGSETTPDIWTKIYSQAKIVLCLHYRDPEGTIPCHQASPRVYEAMACRTFLIVDSQKDVLSLFRSGEGLVVFRDIKELRELIYYYLDHPEERDKIAGKGQEIVLSKHTYRHRIQEMLSIVTGGRL